MHATCAVHFAPRRACMCSTVGRGLKMGGGPNMGSGRDGSQDGIWKGWGPRWDPEGGSCGTHNIVCSLVPRCPITEHLGMRLHVHQSC